MFDRFDEAPISKLIGFNVLPATEEDKELGKALVELEIDERLNNPMGRVHGGVLAALSDAAMGIAFGRTLDPGQDFSTIDLHIHFMRPVRGKKLVARGEMIQRGLRIGYVRCVVTDDRGKEIASSSCSCTVLDKM
ncbi:MAG: PaaI family thioesterase [Planctomycetota bacterium]|nr:PaaI family thioesterase [Planctomycetota bacterium]